MSRFKAITGSGFQITFDNNVTVSVQFGQGAYANKSFSTGMFLVSDTAELAIMLHGESREWLTKDFAREVLDTDLKDDIIGYTTPDVVTKALVWAEQFKNTS